MTKHIVVIGAGTMGNGIAHTFAQTGFKVNLVDVSQEALDRGIKTITTNLDRIIAKGKFTENKKLKLLEILLLLQRFLTLANADLIVEAATENQDLKLKNFPSKWMNWRRKLYSRYAILHLFLSPKLLRTTTSVPEKSNRNALY